MACIDGPRAVSRFRLPDSGLGTVGPPDSLHDAGLLERVGRECWTVVNIGRA